MVTIQILEVFASCYLDNNRGQCLDLYQKVGFAHCLVLPWHEKAGVSNTKTALMHKLPLPGSGRIS